MTTATAKKKAPAKGDPKAEPVNKDRAKVRQATALRASIAKQQDIIGRIKGVLKEAKGRLEFLVSGMLDVFQPDPAMPLFDEPAKDDWRATFVTALELDEAAHACLVAASVLSVGDIVDLLESGRRLEEIPQVTPEMAQSIKVAVEDFRDWREKSDRKRG